MDGLDLAADKLDALIARLDFDPNEPRDSRGQWTTGAGSKKVNYKDATTIGGKMVDFVVNPTMGMIRSMVRHSEIPAQGIRVMRDDSGHVIAWDAFHGIHEQMASALGHADNVIKAERSPHSDDRDIYAEDGKPWIDFISLNAEGKFESAFGEPKDWATPDDGVRADDFDPSEPRDEAGKWTSGGGGKRVNVEDIVKLRDYHGGKEVNVVINPTKAKIAEMVRKVPDPFEAEDAGVRVVRANDGTVYAWDPRDAIHDTMLQALEAQGVDVSKTRQNLKGQDVIYYHPNSGELHSVMSEPEDWYADEPAPKKIANSWTSYKTPSGVDVDVVVNPTPDNIEDLSKENKWNGRVRFVRDTDGNIYAASASKAIHDSIIGALGLSVADKTVSDRQWNQFIYDPKHQKVGDLVKWGWVAADAFDPDEPRDPRGRWTAGQRGFMDEFHAGTEEHPLGMPDRLRYLPQNEGQEQTNLVALHVSPWQDGIHVHSIFAPEPRQGQGTAGLKWLHELADKHNVPLDGFAKAYGEGGMSTARLKKWYAKHGWKVQRSGSMKRLPRGSAADDYDPSEPRDESGKWTGGGGAGKKPEEDRSGPEFHEPEDIQRAFENYTGNDITPMDADYAGTEGGIGFLGPDGTMWNIEGSHAGTSLRLNKDLWDIFEAGYHRIYATPGDMLGIEVNNEKPLTPQQVKFVIDAASHEKFKSLYIEGQGHFFGRTGSDKFEPPEGVNAKNARRYLRQQGMIAADDDVLDAAADRLDALLTRLDWEESQHPRVPEGSSKGGQFTKGAGGAPAEGEKPNELEKLVGEFKSVGEPKGEPTPSQMSIRRVMRRLGEAEEMMKEAREVGNEEMIPRLREEIGKFRKRKRELDKIEHDRERAEQQEKWDDARSYDRTQAAVVFIDEKVQELVNSGEWQKLDDKARMDKRGEFELQFLDKEPPRTKLDYLEQGKLLTLWERADDETKEDAKNIFIQEKMDALYKGQEVQDFDKHEEAKQKASAEFDAMSPRVRHTYLEKAEANLPKSWDELGDEQQEQAKARYVRNNLKRAVNEETSYWREQGGNLDDAKHKLVGEFNEYDSTMPEWFEEAMSDVNEHRLHTDPPHPPIPYTNEQLWKAISLSYEGDGAGGGPLRVEFLDENLRHPKDYDSKQQTLPGIEPEDPSKRLTQEMRDALEVQITDAFDAQADKDQYSVEPDYNMLEENAAERVNIEWDDLNDDQKFAMFQGRKQKLGMQTEMRGKTEWRYVPFTAKAWNPGDLPEGESYSVETAVDPDAHDIEDVMRHSQRGVIRLARMNDGKTYVWDATTVTHPEMIPELGYSYPEDVDDTEVAWGMSGVRYLLNNWARHDSQSPRIAADAVYLKWNDSIIPPPGYRFQSWVARADAFNPNEPRDPQGRWTEGGGTLYHVTHSRYGGSIKKKGIVPLGGEGSNWVKGTEEGERYGAGEVYAFEHKDDAIRWAAKMDWSFNKGDSGKGKISIVHIKGQQGDKWLVDESDPLSQATAKGKWLKRLDPVDRKRIAKVEPVTNDMVRDMLARERAETPKAKEAPGWSFPDDENKFWNAIPGILSGHVHSEGPWFVAEGEGYKIKYSRLTDNWTVSDPKNDSNKWAEGIGVYNLMQFLKDDPKIGKKAQAWIDKDKQEHAATLAEKLKHFRSTAEEMGKRANFDTSKIKFGEVAPDYVLNGRHFKAAGVANLGSGEITLYPGAESSEEFFRGVVAHEMEHQKFQFFLDEQSRELEEIIKLPKPERRRDDPMKPDGTLRTPELREKYPAYSAYTEIIGKHYDELKEEDGVTKYSREWWQAYNNKTANIEQAWHETMAEIAFLMHKDEEGSKVSRNWNKLFNTVNQIWNDRHTQGMRTSGVPGP